MIYHSIQDLLNLAKEYQIPLWEVVCRADMEERQVTKEQSFETMHRMYEATSPFIHDAAPRFNHTILPQMSCPIVVIVDVKKLD